MTCVHRLSRRVAVLAGAAGLWAGAARAQEAAPSPPPEPPKIDVTGFADVHYSYNLNRADPTFRTFDIQHNTFVLSLAEVALAKGVAPDSRVGFRLDLDFGKTADLVAAFEPEEGGKDIYRVVQQAYASLLTGKVQWDVGRFVTPIGTEVIESQDNWNYTRSILFGYAIPFNHTGLRATLPVNDKVSLTGFVLNGWNNGSELNGAKTFALNATLKPTGAVSWYLNYMGGTEVEGGDTRNLFDTTASFNATDKLSFMGNFDYGKEGPVKWWGVAAYAKLQARPNWAVAGRYEYVDDTEGGFMLLGTTGQSLTVTSDHLIANALRARLEYRTDFADGAVFPKHDGSQKTSQTSLTVGLVYTFAGKL